MGSLYNDELKSIKHKSKRVFNKYGIYPFLGNSLKPYDRTPREGGIDGFQIFRLWPEISIFYEDDEED